MKHTPIFIVIPEKNQGLHYIPPSSIIRITTFPDYTSVVFSEGGKSLRITTLLTAEEIHERMMEIEYKREQFMWGNIGGE